MRDAGFGSRKQLCGIASSRGRFRRSSTSIMSLHVCKGGTVPVVAVDHLFMMAHALPLRLILNIEQFVFRQSLDAEGTLPR